MLSNVVQYIPSDTNMTNKKGETVLHIVCKRNNEAGVRFLLSLKGAHFDLSQPDHRGNTPLMLTTNGKVMRRLSFAVCSFCTLMSFIYSKFRKL